MFSDPRFWIIIFIPVITGVILWAISGRDRYGGKLFKLEEMAVGISAAIIVCSLGWVIAKNMSFYKHEQIGGFIDNKWYEDGSHQESETTCTGSGEDEVCTTRYYTVYHRDFFLTNTTGDWWSGWSWHQRVDKSCSTCNPHYTPAYWASAYIGMPVSLDHTYKDYLAANLRKRYRTEFNAFSMEDICPDYPYEQVGYSSADKVATLGFESGYLESWNFAPRNDMTTADFVNVDNGLFELPAYLDTMFGYSGANYQADLMLIFVNSRNIQYADMCLAKWERGPKNAVYVFFFGDFDYSEYTVSNVIVEFGVEGDHQNKDFEDTGKSNYMLKVKLENELMDYFRGGGALDRETVLLTIGKHIAENFNREEQSNYAELARTVKPSDGAMWVIAFIVLGLDILFKVVFYYNDFEDIINNL